MKIIQENKVFYIQDDNGAYWMGPRFPRSMQWEKPRESGGMVPCWMTTSKESAEAQAALLECDPEPSIWEKVAEELTTEATNWREAIQDPYKINYAVSCALTSAAMAVQRAITPK